MSEPRRANVEDKPTQTSKLPAWLVNEYERRGYRLEVSDDGREERLIRPDGTVAVIARKPAVIRLLDSQG